MTNFFNNPLFQGFFDLTVNEGWNLCAIITYAVIAALVITVVIERKTA